MPSNFKSDMTSNASIGAANRAVSQPVMRLGSAIGLLPRNDWACFFMALVDLSARGGEHQSTEVTAQRNTAVHRDRGQRRRAQSPSKQLSEQCIALPLSESASTPKCGVRDPGTDPRRDDSRDGATAERDLFTVLVELHKRLRDSE
jgi:hypothetical protein